MRNEMDYVSVHSIEVVSPSQVVITIDLSAHAHLTVDVVQASMNQFLSELPGLHHWEATASGQWLRIVASGTINQTALARYR